MQRKITLLTFFMSLYIMAQSNKEIANIYFKKAELSMEKIDYPSAKTHYDKGLKVLSDSITTTDIAQQGVFIYYELKHYVKAKAMAKQFFNLSRSKTSEDYEQMLELYVDMEEKLLEEKIAIEKKAAAEKAKKEALKKIDSLKKVWLVKEDKLLLKIDTLYPFNKKGIALFKKKGFYGIMDDHGNIIIEANTYKDVRKNEGYFVLIDNKNNPEKIYCYDSNSERSVSVVPPSKYHEELSDYGKITLPRENGRLIMYPNDISETLVFDFKEEKFIKIANIKEFFKVFKKNDKIDKYDDKERTLKIDKEWYLLGNHIGGQIYSIYSVDDQKLFGYLFAGEEKTDPKLIKKEDLGYLGVYYNNKMVAINRTGEELWFNNEGEDVSKPILNNKYKGDTKIVKTKKGYQLIKDSNVFLRNEKLEKLPDFLRKHK